MTGRGRRVWAVVAAAAAGQALDAPPCSLVTPHTRGRRGRGCWGPSAPRAPPRAPPRACSRSSQWRRPQRGRQTAPPSPCPARPWAVRAPRPPPGGRAPCEWPWMLGGVSQAIRERCLRRRVRGEEAWPCAAAGQTSAREAAARHAARCAPASALDWTCLPLPHGVITNWCYKQRLHGKAKPLNRQARRHFLQAGPMRDCRAACAFKTVIADGCTCRVVLRGLIDTGLNQNWRWRGEMPRQLEWRQRRREARSPLAGRVAARRRRQSLRFALFYTSGSAGPWIMTCARGEGGMSRLALSSPLERCMRGWGAAIAGLPRPPAPPRPPRTLPTMVSCGRSAPSCLSSIASAGSRARVQVGLVCS